MLKLDQKEFSDFIKKGLLLQFPIFTDFLKMDNDILTIEYPSRTKQIELWITTQDLEITVGMDNKDGVCFMHFHILQTDFYNREDELKSAINSINNIFNGTEILVFIGDKIFLSDNPEEIIREYATNEIAELKKWIEI